MLQLLGLVLLVLVRLILGLVLTLLLVLLLFLVIPFRYRLAGRRNEEETHADGLLDWLFGLISLVLSYDRVNGFRMQLMLFSRWVVKSFDITKGGEQAGSASGKAVRGIEKAGKKNRVKLEEKVKKKSSGQFKLTREKLFILVHAGIRVLNKLMPKRMHLDSRIGFDDPADTGTFCAVLAPMQALFPTNREQYFIRIQPVFEEAEATGQIDIQGHIILWFIVWEALKLAISRPFRQDIFGFLKPHRAIAQGGYEHV